MLSSTHNRYYRRMKFFLLYNLQMNFYNFEDHLARRFTQHACYTAVTCLTNCLMYILHCLVSKDTIYYTGYLKTILVFFSIHNVRERSLFKR